jgi:3'(2'), 5'-bisphosphate nucleotidase
LDGEPIETAINVSTTSETRLARFCESIESGHSEHGISACVARRLGITVEPARLDSQAKYGVVARGEADIYMRLPANATYLEKIWDHAGGVLIVEEAGGKVTDVMGRPLEFTHGQQPDVVAALHEEYKGRA